MSALRFQLLGPVRAFRGDCEIALGSPAQRTVLASLLLRAGDVVTLNTISRVLWSDEECPTSRDGLIRTYVSRLRRSLGPPVIERVHDGYRIAAHAGPSDLTEFRNYTRVARKHRDNGEHDQMLTALQAALALWQGAPVMGTTKPFVRQHAEHLDELRVDVLEWLLAAEVELGRHAEIVQELVAAVSEYPLREDLVASCMVALQRCGRTAQAITVYTRTRELLASELGIDPGAKLQACYHAALRRRVPQRLSLAGQ